MQQGAKLIQGDAELFNGFFQIVVKDVVSDAKEVAQEFKQKIQHIIARDKEDNFFLRLYKGRAATSAVDLVLQSQGVWPNIGSLWPVHLHARWLCQELCMKHLRHSHSQTFFKWVPQMIYCSV